MSPIDAARDEEVDDSPRKLHAYTQSWVTAEVRNTQFVLQHSPAKSMTLGLHRESTCNPTGITAENLKI